MTIAEAIGHALCCSFWGAHSRIDVVYRRVLRCACKCRWNGPTCACMSWAKLDMGGRRAMVLTGQCRSCPVYVFVVYVGQKQGWMETEVRWASSICHHGETGWWRACPAFTFGGPTADYHWMEQKQAAVWTTAATRHSMHNPRPPSRPRCLCSAGQVSRCCPIYNSGVTSDQANRNSFSKLFEAIQITWLHALLDLATIWIARLLALPL